MRYLADASLLAISSKTGAASALPHSPRALVAASLDGRIGRLGGRRDRFHALRLLTSPNRASK